MKKLKQSHGFSIVKFFFLTFFTVTLLIQAIAHQIWAKESIKAGIFQNKPIVYFDDGPQGLYVDVLNYVAEKENWEIEYIPCEFKDCLNLLKTNQLDLMTSLGKSSERLEFSAYSKEPIWTFWGTVYSNDIKIHTVLDLKNKKVGVRRKNKITLAFKKLLTKFNISVEYVEFDNYEAAFKALENKTLDVVAVNNTYAFSMQQNQSIFHKTSIVFNPFSAYFAIPKKAGRQILLDKIDIHVKDLKSDPSSIYYAFERKWFGLAKGYWTVKKIGSIGVAALILIVFFMAVWRYRSIISLNKKLTDSIAIQEQTAKVRKQAEKELQASSERFYTVLDSIDATVYVSDMETYEILFMNKHMIESFGRNMTGEICWDAFRGGSGPCAHCTNDRLIDKNGIPTGVYSWQNKNPVTNKWYNNYDRAINWTDGRLVRLQIATDITGFKKMEAQLQQSQKMESIGTLAGGIAHDFNNILFPIIGHSEMMLEDIPEESPLRGGLNQIYTGAIRASELVKQILTFSRQESSELTLMKMQPIIKEALKLIRSSIPTTIEIKQNLQSDCGAIKADPTQMHQIVMNLATNAYHAMEDTGGILNIRLKKIELEEPDLLNPDIKPGAYACLSISDTGKGIDKELIEKIFDPFFTTKQTGKGTGMGLSVVYGIVKNMNGAIHVYSEPEKGTEFHVYLPLAETVKEQQAIHTTTVIQGGTEHILLVDDEKTIIEMEQNMLQRLGYKVTSRSSSIEALEAFRAAPDKFDMVITDMAMPKMSGDKLSVEINKIRPGIPVLLCTGFSETMSEEKATSLGINGFLFKPIVMKDLSYKIREVLDK